jgi:hypothetical protein
MSTILDALKRLESVRQQEAARQTPTSMEGNAASWRVIGGRKIILVIAGLTILCSTAAIVWFSYGFNGQAFFRKGSSEVPVMAAVPVGSFEEPLAASPVKESLVAESAQTAIVSPSITSKPAIPMEDRVSQTSLSSVPPIYGKTIRNKVVSEEASRTKAASGNNSPSVQAAANITTSLTSKNSPRPNPGQAPNTDAVPIARGELQLQAISWSEAPASRVTVIDGRILRESQSIGGYTVLRILPNSVIVHKEGKNWKLEYSSR